MFSGNLATAGVYRIQLPHDREVVTHTLYSSLQCNRAGIDRCYYSSTHLACILGYLHTNEEFREACTV